MAVKPCSYVTNSELVQFFFSRKALETVEHVRSEILSLAALEVEVFWDVRPGK
jgi:hypothetical protein